MLNFELIIYETPDGKSPFRRWLNHLDKSSRDIIDRRLDRIISGNIGDFKFIANGVLELRIDYGPGFRIYFARNNEKIIVLLGGNKSSQKNDILKAQLYWANYKRRNVL